MLLSLSISDYFFTQYKANSSCASVCSDLRCPASCHPFQHSPVLFFWMNCDWHGSLKRILWLKYQLYFKWRFTSAGVLRLFAADSGQYNHLTKRLAIPITANSYTVKWVTFTILWRCSTSRCSQCSQVPFNYTPFIYSINPFGCSHCHDLEPFIKLYFPRPIFFFYAIPIWKTL